MAEDLVQLILHGIQAGQRKKHDDQELSLQQQKLQDEREARQQAHELALKTHDENKALIDAQIKELAAKVAHQSLATKMSITESFLNGQPVPGVEASPMASGTNGAAMSPVNSQQATSQMLTLPKEFGGDEITIPTATQFASQQAKLQEIRDRPKVDADIEKSRKLQEDLLNKQKEAKQEDFLRTIVQKNYDDARQAARDKAEMDRLKFSKNMDLQIAKLKLGEGQLDLKPYAEDAFNGKLSVDDIKKLPIPQQDQIKILGAVNGAAGRVLTKEQKEFLEGFPQLVGSIPFMDQLINNQHQTSTKIGGLVSGVGESFNQNVTVPEDKLTGRLSVISRFLKEKGNLSNQDIKRVGGLVPNRYNSQTANVDKRESYVKELNKLIDSQLSNVPEAQRNVIKKNLGLLDIKSYKSQDQQQQNQQAPQILNWTPQGVVPAGGR